MFWAASLKQGHSVQPQCSANSPSILHLSSASLSPATAPCALQVVCATQRCHVVTLSAARPAAALNLYFDLTAGVQFTASGPGVINLMGYYEPIPQTNTKKHKRVPILLAIMDPVQGSLRVSQYLSHKPRPRSFYYGSRSLNPSYKEIHKLDDVTRYNSSAHIVTRYQSSPNRAGTPKKPLSQGGLVDSKRKRPLSPRTFYLSNIMKTASLVSLQSKKELLGMARNAAIRVNTAGPFQSSVKAHKAMDVMNDFHKRETNAGFARNQLGGFFTH